MIGRRALLGLGPTALVSCARSEGAYFGSTVAPKTRRLVHTLGGEIESLDPAKSTGSHEFYVIPALFEGLTQYHPELPTPMAALATHYEANADFTQFRFYLRGHSAPRGSRLPSTADLPNKFLKGGKPSPDSVRANWSDGSPITAYDFVYSWRRFVDPRTAGPLAFQFFILKNAQAVFSGKRPPVELGVHAPDEFTFVVDLRSSTPFFLEFVTSYVFSAVPRHAVEAARRRNAEFTWTEPWHIVTSGPFTLQDYRRYERIVLVRNPRYYDASLVGLEELAFLPVVDGTTVINLYKAGDAAVTPGISLPPLFNPVLSRKKDYHSGPGFGTVFPCISTRRAPFDSVLLRYALNMATEKKVLADFLGPGWVPARSLIAPLPQYPQPGSLKIEVDGRVYDVLSFDVEGARSLLAKAGFPGGIGHVGSRLEVSYHFPMLPEARPKAEIVQQQWLRALNIGVKLFAREFNVHWRMVLEADYTGVADYAVLPLYLDPNGFLDQFASGSSGNPSGWTDQEYALELETANAVLSRTERLKKLAVCEKHLLAVMPFLPLLHHAWGYLCKPFIRGLTGHLFERARVQVRLDRHQLEAAMSPTLSEAATHPIEGTGLWRDAWKRFRRNRAALAASVLVLLIVVVSLIGPWLVYLYNGFEYDTLGLDNRLANPSVKHLLGTDTLGRDLLARVLYGSRISLMVGLVSTLISLVIGVAYGAIAGYFGGRVDEILMRAVDVLYSLPDILLIVILMALFERSLLLLFVALGATSWLTMARIVRGQVLSLKHEQFVEAARCIGVSNAGIVIRHILPNTLGPIIVYATLTIPSVILAEAFLSFLGLGVPPPASSLGVLAEEGAEAISVHPVLLIAPAVLMAMMLMSLNFFGDGLRDALDPRTRRT